MTRGREKKKGTAVHRHTREVEKKKKKESHRWSLQEKGRNVAGAVCGKGKRRGRKRHIEALTYEKRKEKGRLLTREKGRRKKYVLRQSKIFPSRSGKKG